MPCNFNIGSQRSQVLHLSTRVKHICKRQSIKHSEIENLSSQLDFWAFSANHYVTIKSLTEAAVLANSASDTWGMLKAAQSHTKCLCQLHSNFPHLQPVLVKEKRVREESWKSEQHWAAIYFFFKVCTKTYIVISFYSPFYPVVAQSKCHISKSFLLFFAGAKGVSEVSLNSRQRIRNPLKLNTTHWKCWDGKNFDNPPILPFLTKEMFGKRGKKIYQ